MDHTSTITERDFFTLEEFARRAGIGMSTAYELANRDALPIPVIRVGRRFLLSRHAYQALLDRQHDPSTADDTTV